MRRLLILLAAGILGGCTSVSTNYTEEMAEPSASQIIVCSGHDCAYRTPVALSRADAARFASIMNAGRRSPEAERQAAGKAIQFFEERAAAQLGVRDEALSQFANTGRKGKMDCIDEATNSQSVLRYLHARGLLRHHTVESNMSRGFVLDGQFPHVAAVVKAKNGSKWAVDSWLEPTGGPVTILPLERWLRDGNLATELGGAL